MEQKCLKCEGVLFPKVLLDERGHTAMDAEAPLDIESDGVDSFYRCPHCGAKNVVAEYTSEYGLPQHKIVRYKD